MSLINCEVILILAYDNIANSESSRSKIKITGNTPDADNNKKKEIEVPLKYLSNFGEL